LAHLLSPSIAEIASQYDARFDHDG
jgi:hypothetical protein